MNILIPMAGAGKRFSEAGYKKSKPAIPTYDRRSGKKVPMVVCATMDLPYVELGGGANLIYVDRDFHKNEGIEDEIHNFYPDARFINIDLLPVSWQNILSIMMRNCLLRAVTMVWSTLYLFLTGNARKRMPLCLHIEITNSY